MKKKDIISLHSKSVAELEKELKEAYAKLRTLSLNIAAGKEKNTRQRMLISDDIARIHTVISEKRQGEVKGTV